VRNSFENDESCPLCGRGDDGKHLVICEIVSLIQERDMVLGNMRSKMRSKGMNPFVVSWF